MSRPSIFISHITEEKKLAFALKETIRSSFLGMTDVFVSSDPNDLPAGKKWYEEIMERLGDCSILFLLSSPQSVRRLWIGYEAGAGSIRGIPVIPICHSGMTVDALPPPLNFLQGVDDASSPESLNLIIPTIATALGSNKPEIDFTNFVAAVNAHESENQFFESSEISTDELSLNFMPKYAEQCLWVIADLCGVDEAGIFIIQRKMQQQHSYREVATNLGVKILERLGLIETCQKEEVHNYGPENYTVCSITLAGWSYIEKNISEEHLAPNAVDSTDNLPF